MQINLFLPPQTRAWKPRTPCSASYQTGCNRQHCAPCLLTAAAQARAEAARILETPEIKAMRERCRVIVAAWQAEDWDEAA